MSREVANGELLPWQQATWETWWQARQADRFPHALLVTGPAGVGKRRLVWLLARSLLCPHPDGRGLACGQCRDCRLLAAAHPDYLAIGPDPEGKSDEIKVEAVRRLADTDALTAHRGGYKVIVIDPAQNLNTAAANSLLKTLEEPAPRTLLCLICEQPSRLPATVRSRCQPVKLPVPPEADALAWLRGHLDRGAAETLLRLAHGAPLRALALADGDRLAERDRAFSGFAAVGTGARDPIAEAAAWNGLDPAILLDWFGGWVSDLLLLASGQATPRLINADKSDVLRALARRIEPAQGHRFLQLILRARAAQDTTLNSLLLYESLLVAWARLVVP